MRTFSPVALSFIGSLSPWAINFDDGSTWVLIAKIIATALAPVAMLVAMRLVGAGARVLRAFSAAARAHALELHRDRSPENDATGHALVALADGLDAAASGLEGGEKPSGLLSLSPAERERQAVAIMRAGLDEKNPPR